MSERVPPSYLTLARSGELEDRVRRLEAMLTDCTLCPHDCHVDRRSDTGVCGVGVAPEIASWTVRSGEEPLISGARGSGVVMMASCTLRCVFCAPSGGDDSPPEEGAKAGMSGSFPSKRYIARPLSANELAGIFMVVQDRGCHSLNWVAPSHQVPQLVRALAIAVRRGLHLPVVYSSNSYDSVETLRLLDGVVDVYCPNLRYSDQINGERISGVPDYPARARAALREMYRQIGEDWVLSPDRTLMRGLLIRIEVLPFDLAGVEQSLRWISHELSPRVGISLLAQYRSCHGAEATHAHPLVGRAVTPEEWRMASWALEEHMSGDRVTVHGPAKS